VSRDLKVLKEKRDKTELKAVSGTKQQVFIFKKTPGKEKGGRAEKQT